MASYARISPGKGGPRRPRLPPDGRLDQWQAVQAVPQRQPRSLSATMGTAQRLPSTSLLQLMQTPSLDGDRAGMEGTTADPAPAIGSVLVTPSSGSGSRSCSAAGALFLDRAVLVVISPVDGVAEAPICI